MKPEAVTPRSSFSTINPLCVFLFTVTVLFAGIPAHSQGRKSPGATPLPNQTIGQAPPPSSGLTLDQALELYGKRTPVLPAQEDGSCFLSPLTGVDKAVVQVADLQVPAKAQKEYRDGCAAVRDGKMESAENHLRKVVKEYEKYAAAWVLLGQVLEARQKADEARDACTHPLTALSNYLPSYLCLTDISARLSHWDEVLKLSARALEVDSTTNVAAYAFHATANLNLHHLPEAEKSALRALAIAGDHPAPRLHYLLAQIYAALGDRASVVAQLREYLKFSTDPKDTVVVKNYLAQLEGQGGKPQ